MRCLVPDWRPRLLPDAAVQLAMSPGTGSWMATVFAFVPQQDVGYGYTCCRLHAQIADAEWALCPCPRGIFPFSDASRSRSRSSRRLPCTALALEDWGQRLPPHNTQLSPGCGVLLRCLHMPLTTVSGISLSMILLCSQSEACENHKANDSAAIFKPRDLMVSSGVARPSTQTIHFQTTNWQQYKKIWQCPRPFSLSNPAP